MCLPPVYDLEDRFSRWGWGSSSSINGLQMHPPSLWCVTRSQHSTVLLLPLVLDFEQMKCSLLASKFSSFSSPTLPLYKKCFQIAIPGRVEIFCWLPSFYLVSIFLVLFGFQLSSVLPCFFCHFTSSHCPHFLVYCHYVCFPVCILSLVCLLLTSHNTLLFWELSFWMGFLYCSVSLSVTSCFP